MRQTSRLLHHAWIRLLLAFSPATLFQAIGQLDWYRDTLREWIDDSLPRPEQRIVEVGCATGYLTAYLAGKGHRVTGIDLSPRMIEEAGNRYPQIDFRVASASRQHFGEAHFDGIAAASVINVTDDPGDFLDNIYPLCRPGGWLTLLFPASGFGDDELEALVADLGLTGFSEAALTAWHRLAPKMEVDAVKIFLQQAGFADIETRMLLSGLVASVSARKHPVTG